MSLVADTPENKRRIREGFSSIGQGADAGAIVIELRRKDDGRPIWVQWYSRPEPHGKYTRTVIMDVTEHVLIEQEKTRLEQQNLYLQEEIKGVHNFEEIIGRSPSLTAVIDNVPAGRNDRIHRPHHGRDRDGEGAHCPGTPFQQPAKRQAPYQVSTAPRYRPGLSRANSSATKRAPSPVLLLDALADSNWPRGEPSSSTRSATCLLTPRRSCCVSCRARFDRVGGSTPIRADVRVLAATNRDLLTAVQAKTFREDLYYRLSVFPLHLPPLRDRQEDIPSLAHFLVNKFASRIGKRIEEIDKDTMRRLLAYRWPGNVRELENVIERAVILSDGSKLEIGPEVSSVRAAPVTVPPVPGGEGKVRDVVTVGQQPATLEDTEREHILTVLRQTGWIVAGPRGAAKILALHPNTLRSRMKKLGIHHADHDIS